MAAMIGGPTRASEPHKAATQQDENHGIEVVDVSGLGDGQVLEKAGSKSQARDVVPLRVVERMKLPPLTHLLGHWLEFRSFVRVSGQLQVRKACEESSQALSPLRGFTGMDVSQKYKSGTLGSDTTKLGDLQGVRPFNCGPRVNKEQPPWTLKFAHRCLSDLTNKPRASLPSSPARSSSVRPRSSSQPPGARRCTDLRQDGDSTDCLHLFLSKPTGGGIVFWNKNLRTQKDWTAGTLPAHGNASSSCPAGGNPLSHPETPVDVAGLIPDLVHARVQEETRQVDLAHLQQVRKSDLDSPTAPHQGELDLNPLGEDLVLGLAQCEAQELITKAVATQQADLFDAWAQEQGGKVDTTPMPTVEAGLGEPDIELEMEHSLDEQSDDTLHFQTVMPSTRGRPNVRRRK
ncbi:hypothetical protein SELMODRAFT_421425 [Selaginella moellendorffii]|uniref:Uncharacterized protein n=1 Tax=Selaginella moellendorffii TaxID=88036 RepID=D8SF87_SELML|nr:hypothetical protein SELMODRAFT_421425 [Selaginella moellendorffii]